MGTATVAMRAAVLHPGPQRQKQALPRQGVQQPPGAPAIGCLGVGVFAHAASLSGQRATHSLVSMVNFSYC